MKASRLGSAVLLSFGAAACSVTPRAAAPALFSGHFEGAALPLSDPGGATGFTGSADVEIGRTGCCSAGLFVAATSLAGVDAQSARVKESLQGGVQLGVSVPVWDDRIRVRARFGKAGTPPSSPLFGRSGFATSTAVVLRMWQVEPPETNQFAPNVDFLLGLSTLSLGQEQSSAGALGGQPLPGRVEAPDSFSHAALMLGLRIGADFGVDLE